MPTDHVARVVDALKGLSGDQVGAVLGAAQLRLRESTVAERRRALDALFTLQLGTLADRYCPDVIREHLVALRKTVVDKALTLTIPADHLPFILVVPPPFLSYHTLAQMMRNGDKIGYTNCDARLITDLVRVSDEPYAIYDVEDGRAMLDKSPETAEKLITTQKRFGLTVAEALHLCIQTNTFNHHFMNAVGSRYDSDCVPGVWRVGSRPYLYWGYRDYANSKWGAASCGSR